MSKRLMSATEKQSAPNKEGRDLYREDTAAKLNVESQDLANQSTFFDPFLFLLSVWLHGWLQIMIPIPQYPLYSASITLQGGSMAPYYLSEERNWSLDVGACACLICLQSSILSLPRLHSSGYSAILFFFFFHSLHFCVSLSHHIICSSHLSVVPFFAADLTSSRFLTAPPCLSFRFCVCVQHVELERSLKTAHDAGLNVRGIVIINPGNPTGACLSEKTIRQVGWWWSWCDFHSFISAALYCSFLRCFCLLSVWFHVPSCLCLIASLFCSLVHRVCVCQWPRRPRRWSLSGSLLASSCAYFFLLLSFHYRFLFFLSSLTNNNISNFCVYVVSHHQDNIYQDDRPFVSFKKVLRSLGPGHISDSVSLASFHSISKGFFGECGRRGGYMELINFPELVKDQIYKLLSVNLCSNIEGQLFVCMQILASPCSSLLWLCFMSLSHSSGFLSLLVLTFYFPP